MPVCEWLEQLDDKVAEREAELLADLKIQIEYHKTTDGLTKEYFLEQLANGAIETVIIKLCVKLEGILRAKFHLEGDFYTMLNTWREKHGYYSDEEGYSVERNDARLLQKLRMHRNALVHPEEGKELLTIEEIKECIEVVCNLE